MRVTICDKAILVSEYEIFYKKTPEFPTNYLFTGKQV